MFIIDVFVVVEECEEDDVLFSFEVDVEDDEEDEDMLFISRNDGFKLFI